MNLLHALFLIYAVTCIPEEFMYNLSDYTLWMEHLLKYKLKNTNNERNYRNFRENLEFIRKHNRDPQNTYYLKLNSLAHLSTEEYKRLRKPSFKISARKPRYIQHQETINKITEPPIKVDWRTKGVVTPVKDQGFCISDWAYSVTGAIESHYKMKYNKTVSLSEQQLLDCTTLMNYGCYGGYVGETYIYTTEAYIATEDKYEYHGVVERCKNVTEGVRVKAAVGLNEGDMNVVAALASIGPLSVVYDGSQETFRFYGGGIYYDLNCIEFYNNHAGVAVGYSLESGNSYYIIKNSWGTDWGEGGYIRILLGNDHCGVALYPAYPIV